MVHAVTVGTCPDSLLAMETWRQWLQYLQLLDACLHIMVGLTNEQAIQNSQPTFEANLLLLVPSIQEVMGSNLGSNTGYL